MRWREHAANGALLGALVGCAPAATPTTEVTTPTGPVPQDDVVSTAELPVAEVAAPEGLFATAHIPPLAALERQLLELAGAPAGAAPKLGSNWLSHVLTQLDRNAGTHCASSVTWCKKHDEPELNTACALPIANYARAKRELALQYRNFRVQRGVHRYFVPRNSGEPGSFAHPAEEDVPSVVPQEDRDTIPWNHAACDLTRAAGPAPARLTCAVHNQSLERLRPWLTRGAPARATPPERAHLEIEIAKLRRGTLPFLRAEADDGLKDLQRMMVDRFGIRDPELLQLPQVLSDQFFQLYGEATRVVADAEIMDRSAQLTVELELGRARSWPAQLVHQQLERAAPPPEMFWQLPSSSTAAGFSQGVDERHVRPVFDGVARVVRVALQVSRLAPKTLRAVDDLFTTRPGADAVGVWAGGLDESVRTVERGDSGYVRTLETFASGFGWSIWGTETPHREVVAWLESARRLVDQLHRESATNRGLLASLGGVPKVRRKRAPRGYPRGSVVFDIEFPTNQEIYQALVQRLGNPSYLTPPSTISKRRVLRMVAVPQGASRTWIGLAFNHDLLRRQLDTVLRGKPGSQLAAARDQLNSLSSRRHVLGGFTSVCELARPSFGLSSYAYPREMRTWLKLVTSTPRHGSTPIVYSLTGEATDHPKLRFEATLTKPNLLEAFSMLPALIPESDSAIVGPVGVVAP
jgi:hypothetical protein